MPRQSRLGRGLEAIFSQRVEPSVQKLLPVDEITPNPYQPRKQFNEDSLKRLADSIKKHGVLQPIVVRERDGRFEIVAGERRWRAAKLAGLDRVPAIIREIKSEDEMLVFALIENLEREDLSPVDKALAIKKLKEEFKATDQEIGRIIGKSRSAITNTLRLLELPQEVLDMLAEGLISEGHARVLLRLKDRREMVRWARKVAEEGLTVRSLERMLSTGGEEEWVREFQERIRERGLRGRIKRGKRGLTLEIKFRTREELEEFLSRI